MVIAVATVVLLAAVAGAVVALLGLFGGDDSGPGGARFDRSAHPSPLPASAPETIPAVRHWDPGHGPGWRPGEDVRVLTDPEGPLVDEARLLAEELDGHYAEGGEEDAGPGDVVLVQRYQDDLGELGPEGYELTVDSGRVTIAGSRAAGVFYGTRTLLQGVRAEGRLSEGRVRDWPERAQRGLMLDVARKHYDAAWIEDRIRELGDLKLNQLQLHLSDDQAFRVESDSHPEVVSDPALTKDQLRRIVALAASRHVTVIPEFDSPGHLGAVIEAHPDLQLRDADGEPVRGAVDISRPKAARIVDDLLREYAPLFRDQPGPGPYWHLGGDEYGALTVEDPDGSFPGLLRAARKEHGERAGLRDLTADWLNDRARLVRSLGFTPEVWNDGMHPGGVVEADRDRQVSYWTGREIGAREPAGYLEEGRRLINFNDEYLYYVLGEPNDFTYPTGERIYREWTPQVLRGADPEPAASAGPEQVRGARFAIWGDLPEAQTTDEVAAGIRLPLRALAQKVWDPRTPRRDWAEFRALAERVG